MSQQDDTSGRSRGRDPGLFERAIGKPTGRNGYEELVRAMEELAKRRLFKQAMEQSPAATLSLRRRVLQDAAARRALALVERGLAKQPRPPRSYSESEEGPPELVGYRDLARLLRLRQSVRFADGEVSEALLDLERSLRLGRVLQGQDLLYGLVGIAVTAIGVKGTGAHLDQLAAADCEQLSRICATWLERPDRFPAVLAAERRGAEATLQRMRTRGVRYIEEMIAPPSIPDSETGREIPIERDEETEALIRRVREAAATPAGLAGLLDRVQERLDRHFSDWLSQCSRPPWERRWPEFSENEDLPGQIADLVAPVWMAKSDAYVRERALLQLLAAHAAVLRYRWEHDRLPATLAELTLGAVAVDPFTGKPLQYQVNGRRYRLVSVGPETFADDPRAVGGRVPVSVVPGE